MKLFPISLGCSKNKVDCEVLIGNLTANASFSLTDDISEADLIMINTCAFIEAAKEEAINTILGVVSNKTEGQKVIVTGCLSTRYKDEISNLIPEVDRFITISEYPKLKEIVNSLFKEHPFSLEFDQNLRLLTSLKETVYVKISEGCNNRCTYCAIPLIRGRFVSRAREDIIAEVKDLVQKGAKEVNLISQDTTNYGLDLYRKEYNIINLLTDLCAIEGAFKIRLLYLYPTLVSDELICFIRDHEKVMPYFDIPLQHSENRLLKLMNRRGSREDYLCLIQKIREQIPNAILRTTMIVGFASETEEEFKGLLSFIKEVKFDRLGAFTYSAEEDTVGATLPEQIPQDVKERRLEELYKTQEPIALELNQKHLHEVMDVLITGYDEDAYAYTGRSYAFAPDDIDGIVNVYSSYELTIGQVYKVEIINATLLSLDGRTI